MNSEAPYLFVSYASADRERVLPLVDRLAEVGVRTWVDRAGIHGGDNYAQVIADAIQHAAAMLVVCSPASLASRNVKQELALAWRFETPYLPLLLEPVEIPNDVAYWLEGSQWIELLDRPESAWLADLVAALQPLGIASEPSAGQAPPPPAAPEQPALIGRSEERSALRAALDATLAARGGLVLVSGEAGIGKTTLVEDLSAQAEREGCLTLWGRAYDLSVTPPYGPWIEIARRYQASGQQPPFPVPLDAAEALAALGSQQHLFDAVIGFLQSLAARRPLVVILDDLHWADEGSLDLLRALAREVADDRLLLVATYRGDELGRAHPLGHRLPLLVRESHARRIALKPWDAADLAAALLPYGLDEADQARLVAYLEARTEGNPLYTAEVMRSLLEEGHLVERDGRWVLGDLARTGVPKLLLQVIDARLARLPEESRQLLRVAAIIGEEVPLDLWQRVSGASDDDLATAIEEGQEARLIEEEDSSYRFRHALLRQALYDGMISLRRRVWHRRVAEELEAAGQPDPDRVAYHYRQAGDPRAMAWLVAAGGRAQQEYLWSAAVERFEAALALMTEQAAPAAERAVLLYRLAFVLRFSDASRALALLDEARQLASGAGERGLAGYYTFFRGLLQCFGGDVGAGLPAMEQGNALLASLSADEQARLVSLLGLDAVEQPGTVVLWMALIGPLEEARARGERLLAVGLTPVLRPGADGSDHADALQGLAVAQALLGQPDAARRSMRQAVDAYRAIEDHAEVAGTCGNELDLVQLSYFPDERETRRRLADEASAAGERALGAGGGIDARAYVLPLLVIEGSWTAAREVAAHTYQGANWAGRLHAGRHLSLLARHQGDAALAQQVIGELLPRGPGSEPGTLVLRSALPLIRVAAELALDAGDLPDALAWLEAHDRWLAASGVVPARAPGALLWSRYHQARGDAALARRQAEQALAHASEPRQPLALAGAYRLLGRLALHERRLETAEGHLLRSLALAEACAAPFEQALTLLELTELRIAEGKAEESCGLLADVRQLCEPLAARPALARAEEMEGRLVVVPATSYPAGLTAREVEVLRLVAQGLTDPEVAEKLYLSPRTVSQHLRNIYNKLGVNTRVAATRFAVEQRLL